MLNNKPTGMTLTRLLILFALGNGLMACATAPEELLEPEVIAMAEPEPVPPPTVMKPDHPDRYVVVKGDTLWGISERFLNDPWLWPKVWQINPNIRNPHLIYPGDVIVLYYVDGKPYLTLEGMAGVVPLPKKQVAVLPPKDINTVKLSPQIRYDTLERAIDTIPRSAIGPFLYRPRVVTKEEIEDAPYIVSSYEEHLIAATGNRVYAKNVTDANIVQYGVIRPGQVYRDPKTNEVLGYEVIRVAAARLVRSGNPATLDIVGSKREVFNGDLLLPSEESELDFNFFPQPPRNAINGQIISVFDGLSQIGQYNVVVLNRGKREGLVPGNVLAIYQSGNKVPDPQATRWVTLPDERAGILMVFRTYEKVSYALVMKATRVIHINDRVTNP